MSEEHRSAFILREVEGLSYSEMSKILGITKGTVMSRLFYARKKLMEGLRAFKPNGANLEGNTESSEGADESEVKLNILLS